MRAKHLTLTCFFFFVILTCGYAKDIYVTGVTKITMRTGPGTEHKIVAMLTSGTKLGVVEYNEDWSEVKTLDGKDGWVLTRFLTEEVPKALVVEQLKVENARLESELAQAREKLSALKTRNNVLTEIEAKYKQLKDASANYLKLDAEHKALLEQSKAQEERIQSLEKSMHSEIKLGLLSGAGVFIVGLIFGLSTRKKKRHSLLS